MMIRGSKTLEATCSQLSTIWSLCAMLPGRVTGCGWAMACPRAPSDRALPGEFSEIGALASASKEFASAIGVDVFREAAETTPTSVTSYIGQ